MSDSDSEDPTLAEEERRIREQYGLEGVGGDDDGGGGGGGDNDADFADAAGGDGGAGGGGDLAAAAIEDQIQRLQSESERLQEERDLLKEQVGNFEDLLLAMRPVEGVDPAKFTETIMVDGVEVVRCWFLHAYCRGASRSSHGIALRCGAVEEDIVGPHGVCPALLSKLGPYLNSRINERKKE